MEKGDMVVLLFVGLLVFLGLMVVYGYSHMKREKKDAADKERRKIDERLSGKLAEAKKVFHETISVLLALPIASDVEVMGESLVWTREWGKITFARVDRNSVLELETDTPHGKMIVHKFYLASYIFLGNEILVDSKSHANTIAQEVSFYLDSDSVFVQRKIKAALAAGLAEPLD